MMKDNRQFIEALEKTGDVVRVRQEVDWDLEAGAIVRRTNEKLGPAPLFEKLKDYPSGYRIFGSPLGTNRRLAIALGLKPDASIRELQDEYESRMEHPIKPEIVKEAPCKGNILKGEEADLFKFPVPMIHEGDGGRHIGTWHMIIARDPGSDWVNWGMYRMMAYSRCHATLHWGRGNHGGRIFFGKYVPQRRPMPLAIAIGADPLCCLTAASNLNPGQSEAEFAGALHKGPVELVKAETDGLLVPAHAEIILEGEVLPDVRALDGPHGEFTGYRTCTRYLHPFRVNTITYRKDPILTMTCMGMPVQDSDICVQLSVAIYIKKRLRQSGLPVKDVYLPEGASSYLAIISLQSNASDRISQMENLVKAHGMGDVKIIVVDGDVDVFDLNQVLHALATKCHPINGIHKWELNYNIDLTPYLNDEERREGRGVRALFDSTWPPDWSRETDIPPRVSFQEVYPDEIKGKVIKNWEKYGFR